MSEQHHTAEDSERHTVGSERPITEGGKTVDGSRYDSSDESNQSPQKASDPEEDTKADRKASDNSRSRSNSHDKESISGKSGSSDKSDKKGGEEEKKVAQESSVARKESEDRAVAQSKPEEKSTGQKEASPKTQQPTPKTQQSKTKQTTGASPQHKQQESPRSRKDTAAKQNNAKSSSNNTNTTTTTNDNSTKDRKGATTAKRTPRGGSNKGSPKREKPRPKSEGDANLKEQQKSKKETDEHGGEGDTKKKRGGSETARSNPEMSDGRQKQKEYFKLELQRLETSLKREYSKIQEPPKKAYTPYTFNDLKPYYNTRVARFLNELPEEMTHGHTSRNTAQGLTDPWLDLRMDRELPPVNPSKPVSRQVAILKREKEIRERQKRSAANQSGTSRKGGSTRLPKFPVVQLEVKELARKPLFYNDVPTLRHELKTKYSSSAKTKIAEDYERTHQDFYRMELDKLEEIHPINRGHMTSAYFAYLQNTPGSKKAINECVRGLKSGKA